MYQAYATLALLLVIFEYWYGGYGVRWGFITKDKKKLRMSMFQTQNPNWGYCKRITTISTHAQLSPQIKWNL